MSLGVEAIDADHKALIDLPNRLDYMIRAGDEPDSVEKVLEELRDYGERHFAREKQLIAECGYPNTAEHRDLHRTLTERLQAYRRADHVDPAGFDATALYDFVSDWLLVQVLEEDMKIKPHLPKSVDENRP